MKVNKRKIEDEVQDVTRNKRLKGYVPKEKDQKYVSVFGLTLDQIPILIKLIYDVREIKKGWSMTHLLWTLMYLKQYPIIDEFCVRLGTSKNTLKNICTRLLN